MNDRSPQDDQDHEKIPEGEESGSREEAVAHEDEAQDNDADSVSDADGETAPEDTEAQEEEQPGPPARPPFVAKHPALALCYFFTSAVLALSQSFSQSIASVNMQQLQGAFGATQYEMMWLTAAYMFPNASLTLVLLKIRFQYGLRPFAEVSIVVFLLAALLGLAATDFWSNLGVRFLCGIAAAPMTSMAVLYALDSLPPEKKLKFGLPFALTCIFLGSPLTRVVSPYLVGLDGWHSLMWFEIGMAALALGLIYLLPLTPMPRMKAISSWDITSFIFIFIGFGCLAVAFTLGAIYWWTTQAWLGWVLIAAIGSLAVAAAIEFNRDAPFVDLRWIFSPSMFHFALVLLFFRVLLSEQLTGVSGLFRVLSVNNDQQVTLWVIVAASIIAGGVICMFFFKLGRIRQFHFAALILIICGALLDTRVTSQYTPENMYLSQFLIGMASSLFVIPSMVTGIVAAFQKGMQYLLSFIIVFLMTQKIGAFFGSSLFQSFMKIRTQVHKQDIYTAMGSTDPNVLQTISTVVKLLSSTLTDTTLRKAEAVAQLATKASTQATVMAYRDTYAMIAFLGSCALVFFFAHIAYDYVVKMAKSRNVLAEQTQTA